MRSKEPYSIYYRILGFVPNDMSIYEQAFLHRSASAKTEKGKWINNERLEFLGDAILDSVVADILFHKFENKKEGFLTNTRSKIVQRETLNKLAIELGLDKLVVSATKGISHNNYMYGNAFEAFVGAIYIDQGYDVCKEFIENRVIAKYLDLSLIARKEVNFKSKLIEWSQKNKATINFELIESFNDADNNPVFQTQVVIMGIRGGIGTGYSKKESQQNAAKATLKKLKGDQEFKDSVEAVIEKANNPDENAKDVQTLISSMTTEWVDNGLPTKPQQEDVTNPDDADITAEMTESVVTNNPDVIADSDITTDPVVIDEQDFLDDNDEDSDIDDETEDIEKKDN